MNNKRRARLHNIINSIERISEQISFIADEELDSLENMPENLSDSERFERMEDNADKLNDAYVQLDSVAELISEVING